MIQEKYGQDATNVGDEGGFAPNILENSEGEGESFGAENLQQNSNDFALNQQCDVAQFRITKDLP